MRTKYTREVLEPVVEESTSFSQVVRKLGLKITGGNQTRIKDLISYWEIDTTHFKGQGWNKGLTKETSESVNSYSRHLQKYTDEELLSIWEHPISAKGRIRRLLMKHLEYVCECGQPPVWKGKELTLHVDHKNGNRLDNRIENLRWLCPNCHQQTNTWGNCKNGS